MDDNFSARWTGRIRFEGGSHCFIARGDDGTKVRVDGELIINEWDYKPNRFQGDPDSEPWGT